jgi:hypothetical protein
MNRKPTPLVRDAAVPQAQRELLELARRTPPARYDVEAGAARFLAALEVPSSATTPRTVPPTAGVHRAVSFANLKLSLLVLPVGLLLYLGASWKPGGLRAERPARPAAVNTHDELASATTPVETAQRQELPGLSGTVQRTPQEQGSTAVGPNVSPRTVAAELEPGPHLQTARPSEHAETFERERKRPGRSSVPARTSGPAGVTQTRATKVPLTAGQANVGVGLLAPADTSVRGVDERLDESAPTDSDRNAPVLATTPIDELQAIASARRLVAASPRTALALLAQVEREHPRGYLAEEREALTVLALFEAGERKLAERQALSFLQRHPQSPYAVRIRSSQARPRARLDDRGAR